MTAPRTSDDETPDPETNTAAKCTFCAHRIDVGLEPACVVVCPEHAILAGERCKGCQAPEALPPRPTPDARLLAEYALALRNMARRAIGFGERPLGDALFARAKELELAEERR